jgi:hypothetical protein
MTNDCKMHRNGVRWVGRLPAPLVHSQTCNGCVTRFSRFKIIKIITKNGLRLYKAEAIGAVKESGEIAVTAREKGTFHKYIFASAKPLTML